MTPERSGGRIGYIPALDGIRGLLLPGVVVFHYALYFGGRPGAPGWLRHVAPFILNIQMFFVLSGALITSLLVAEYQRSGSVSLRKFYLRRYRRLGPVLIAVLPLMVLAQLAWSGDSYGSPLGAHPWLAFGAVAAFVGNWVLFRIDGGIGWLGPAWSLGVEEQFYLSWPLLLRSTLRRELHRLLVLSAMATTTIVCVGLAAISYRYAGSARTYYASFTQLPSVIAGCALGYELTTNPGGRFAGLLRSRLVGVVGAVGVLLASYELIQHDRYLYRGGYLLYAAFACLLVGHCFVVAGNETILTRILGWRPLMVMGQISYEAYLIHVIVIFAVAGAAPTMGVYPMMALDSAIVLAFSLSFYYLIEQPIRRDGWREFLGRLRQPLPALRVVDPRRRLALAGGFAAGFAAIALVGGFIVTQGGAVSGTGGSGTQTAAQAEGRALAGLPGGEAAPSNGNAAQPPATTIATPGVVVPAPVASTGRGNPRNATSGDLAVPTVSGLTPPVTSLLGGSTITVHGTGFIPGSRLYIGSVRVQVHRVSSTTLTFVAPAARLVDAGQRISDLQHVAVSIFVRTAGGVSVPNSLSVLTYV